MMLCVTPILVKDSTRFVVNEMRSGQCNSSKVYDKLDDLVGSAVNHEISFVIHGKWNAQHLIELANVSSEIMFRGSDPQTIREVLAYSGKLRKLTLVACDVSALTHQERVIEALSLENCTGTASWFGLSATTLELKFPLLEPLHKRAVGKCVNVFARGVSQCSSPYSLERSVLKISDLNSLNDGSQRHGLHLLRLRMNWRTVQHVLKFRVKTLSFSETELNDYRETVKKGAINPWVRTLKISMDGLESQHLGDMLSRLPNLETLEVSHLDLERDAIIATSDLQYLQHLDISNAGRLRWHGIRAPQVRSVACSSTRHQRRVIERMFPAAKVTQVDSW